VRAQSLIQITNVEAGLATPVLSRSGLTSSCYLRGKRVRCHRATKLAQDLRQDCAWYQLQHQVVNVIGVFKAVDGGNIGVVQLSQEFGFPFKTRQPLRVLGELL